MGDVPSQRQYDANAGYEQNALSQQQTHAPASLRQLLAMAGLALVLAGLCALGVWQLQRREWKHALIEQVEQRVHAPATLAPASGEGQEYRHVAVHGHYLIGHDTLVQASTDFGPGFWLISPLIRDDGTAVLINRGFIPPELRQSPPAAAAGDTEVVGLLRLSEPKGRILRDNDPSQERWYSRDVAAIAKARGIAPVLPYFIDAEAGPAPWPRGGLTVLAFADNHLIYALTWFAMAMLLLGLTLHAHRQSRR